MTNHTDADSQQCPICGATQQRNLRYPRYLCPECAAQASDEVGRRLQFTGLGCGFRAAYVDTGELRNTHVCFVRGRQCWADEAHFGGIVIQSKDAECH